MSDKYILDENNNPIPEPDLMKWGKWLQTAKRHVADDEANDVRVSTVFLGLDHSFGQGPPILYETMIFGGEHDGYQDRYATRAEAIEGHKKALKLIETKAEDECQQST